MQSVEEVAARRSNKERAVEVCGNLAAISAACGLGGGKSSRAGHRR